MNREVLTRLVRAVAFACAYQMASCVQRHSETPVPTPPANTSDRQAAAPFSRGND